ncbi:MAG TPA: hypothetical protein VK590_14990 [Saprospiraceae bacterium]|nr:hypothetical protein [Saprospiraceae bacterium]
MFKTQVLADKLTHLTDARYFAARGVDILCFSIPEEQALDKALMSIHAILSWVEGPKIYLRPGFRSTEEIISLCNDLNPEAIIVPYLGEAIEKDLLNCKLVLDLIIESEDFVETGLELIYNANPDGIICEIRNKKDLYSSWLLSFLSSVPKEIVIFIKLSFAYVDPLSLLELPIQGIAIEGSLEEKLGLKSFDKIDSLLDELEI